MLFIDCYGKNIYVDKKLAGYISLEGDFFASGHKFGSMTEYGEIYLNDEYVGYIEDNGDIFIGDIVGGYTENGNLYFDSEAFSKR